MNFFKTLAMVGLVGVGMINGGMCKEAKDSDSATNPVVSSRWEVDGWTGTQNPEEADFAVTVSYAVPGVVKDRDTFFFKKAWVEVRKYADGSTSEDGTTSLTGLGKSRCGGGSGCSGAANVDASDDGLRVFLNLHWSGKKTGKLKREFLVPWSELEKSVKDDDCEIHVTVSYQNPSQDKDLSRLQAAKKLPVPLPPTTPYDSDPRKRAVYLEEYQSAYRSILAAVDIGCHMGVKGETFFAYQDGWTAGIKTGRKDHPEKWAEMLGVPLDCILQWQKNQSEHPSPSLSPMNLFKTIAMFELGEIQETLRLLT